MKNKLGISLEQLLKQKTSDFIDKDKNTNKPDQNNFTDDFFIKGVELLKKGFEFEALIPLFACLAHDSNYLKAANNISIAFWKLKCPELAIKMANMVLLKDPDNIRAKQNLKFMKYESKK